MLPRDSYITSSVLYVIKGMEHRVVVVFSHLGGFGVLKINFEFYRYLFVSFVFLIIFF